MTENYITILIESLHKKVNVLNQLIEKNKQQAQVLKEESFDMDAFDRNADEKGELINSLELIDQGFESVYDRMREELLSNKASYKKEITLMQKLIAEITDLSVTVQTQEARNKQLVEKTFKRTRETMRTGVSGSKVALDYYKSMNQVNYIDPQFMDQKK